MRSSSPAPLAFLLHSVLAAALAGCSPAPAAPRHTIVVEARYPGANARAVADTIAAPIEQQINGVENMLTMRSRASDDGTCVITVTFAPGVDLDLAQTLVQNRTSLALPALPEVVQREGVVVRKGPAGVALILFLSSPDGRFDPIYLGNYAKIQVKEELGRAAGVGEVALVGSLEYSLRLTLDPDQLAAFGLATTDVVQALERQNLRPDAAPAEPQPGKPLVLQITVGSLGRPAHVEELNDLVIRADAGRNIRLRDVARVELGAARPESQAQFDGKPGVALAIHLLPLARPRDVSAAVQQVTTRLAANLPDGMALDIAFDFTANLEAAERATSPQHVLLEMDAPPGTTAERRFAILDRADQVVRQGRAAERVLILTDNVFDHLPDRPCLLIRVASDGQAGADRDASTSAIRRELEKQIAGAAFRLRDLSRPNAFPRGGYPIDFAVQGPKGDKLRSFARKLAERLCGSNKLTDVWTDAEVADRPSRDEMVPLAALVTLREVTAPGVEESLNLLPMVELTANPAAGTTLSEIRTLCETLAGDVRAELQLPADYRLTWLDNVNPAK